MDSDIIIVAASGEQHWKCNACEQETLRIIKEFSARGGIAFADMKEEFMFGLIQENRTYAKAVEQSYDEYYKNQCQDTWQIVHLPTRPGDISKHSPGSYAWFGPNTFWGRIG